MDAGRAGALPRHPARRLARTRLYDAVSAFPGVLIVVISVCCWAEVARAGRYLNLPVSLWLLAAPFLLDGGDTAATINAIACGVAVIGLSLPRGKVLERYGTWERYIV